MSIDKYSVSNDASRLLFFKEFLENYYPDQNLDKKIEKIFQFSRKDTPIVFQVLNSAAIYVGSHIDRKLLFPQYLDQLCNLYCKQEEFVNKSSKEYKAYRHEVEAFLQRFSSELENLLSKDSF